MVAWHEMPGKGTPHDPSRRDGMIGSNTRGTTRAMNQDGIRDNRARSIFAMRHPRLGHACVTY